MSTWSSRFQWIALSVAILVSSLGAFICLPYASLPKASKPWSSAIPNVLENLQWDGERPLNILFMTWGSRGDHQPNIALGLELARRGHNVTVMAMEKYSELLERHYPLISYRPLIDNYLWGFANALSQSDGTAFLPLSVEYVFNTSRELTYQYIDAAKDIQADVLFGSHSAMLMLHHLSVAQTVGKPLFFLTHDQTLPSRYRSFNMDENRNKDYGAVTNMFNHRIFSLVLGAALTISPTSPWRAVRSELNLTTPWPFMEVLHPSVLADIPVFLTADTTLWPRPPDYPSHWYSTGFFVTRSDETESIEYKQSRKVLEWIRERKESVNRPILYFGQGSFDHHERELFTDIFLNTLEALQMDGITLKSTVDDRFINDDSDKYRHVFALDQMDQTLLFPQLDVIVHHGGAGSASQAIRSGKPSICIPSMPFQQVWGGAIEEFGAGTLLLPDETFAAWKNVTNLLTAAVRKVLESEAKEKASVLGESALKQPDGVNFAAAKVEEHMKDIFLRKKQSVPEMKMEL